MSQDIAIVGVALRAPGAPDAERFWANLAAGVDSIQRLDAAALAASGVDEQLLQHPAFVPCKGVLEGGDEFDSNFFRVSGRDATLMDPQHRVFLQCCWHALEHAGYAAAAPLRKVSVFAGLGLGRHEAQLPDDEDWYRIMAHAKPDYLALRVAHQLGLEGPAVTVQTACSTSLVAVHLACQSLRAGESELALAGGVSLCLPLQNGYLHRSGGTLSADGRCRPFDAGASGTVFGDGVGVVALRRLDHALASRDSILAVIKGSAVNNDGGHKAGFAAPSVEGQVAVIESALAQARLSAASVGYVEAHGTGTALGDAVEVEALARTYGAGRSSECPCIIGSVKGNVGHLDAAAGVTGLIKAALALQHGELPPTANFETGHPELRLCERGLEVRGAASVWPQGPIRRAAVSSFGIGGTNAHVVLEEAPPAPARKSETRREEILLVSARSPTALEALKRAHSARLRRASARDAGALSDVCFTAAVGRRHFEWRCAVRGSDAAELAWRLEACAPVQVDPRARTSAWVFSGAPLDARGAVRELWAGEPRFEAALRACFRASGLREASLLDALEGRSGAGDARARFVWQFCVQHALDRLWAGYGVLPAARIGWGLGGLVAAVASGAWTLDAALAQLHALADEWSCGEPQQLELLGTPEAIAVLTRELGGLRALRYSQRRLAVEGARARLDALQARAVAAGVRVQRTPAELPLVLDAAGVPAPIEGVITAAAAAAGNALSGCIERLAPAAEILLELGPASPHLRFALADSDELDARCRAFALLSSGSAPRALALRVLEALYLRGEAPDWPAVMGNGRARVALPPYPFAPTVHVPPRRAAAAYVFSPTGVPARSTSDARSRRASASLAAPPSVGRAATSRSDIERLIQQLLGLPVDVRVDPQRSFKDLGMDSLLAVEAVAKLGQLRGELLPKTLLLDYPTLDALYEHLARQDASRSAPPTQPWPAASEQPKAPALSEPIAIIGTACRFPGGASSSQEFWQQVLEGRDAVAEVPQERWNVDDYYDADPEAVGKTTARHMAAIAGVDLFDAAFFGIAPREAAALDPQQRLLLELGWQALEDAGIVPASLLESRTGVFIGVARGEYGERRREADAYTLTGVAASTAAGRISYVLGLRGPNLALDTACSSSLVAVHQACQSLQTGESELALAGGVNLILSPHTTVAFSKLRALSPDGRCKTFDAAANGYVRGEGCGMVVLKRLDAAARDGDRVLAVLLGTAINQDGRSHGLTAPNGPAQEALIRDALAAAGLPPEQVRYVEAHGTGTPLGDPIEARAIDAVYGAARSEDDPLYIGSVKTNIGHLETAAGIAGLLKVVHSVRSGWLAPSLHFSHPNPEVPWARLRVPCAASPWPAGEGPRVAAVSSFGFSGTNAHAIVAQPAEPEARPAVSREGGFVLPLSAACAESLQALALRYADDLERRPEAELGDVCHTASVRRTHHPERVAFVASSGVELARQLRAFAEGRPAAGVLTRQRAGSRPRVAFVFSGHGSQWQGMGRQLLEREPVFRRSLQLTSDALAPHLGCSILDCIAGTEPDGVREFRRLQPALFALQVAFSRLLLELGVVPEAVLGHSLGEIAAAHVAGVLCLEDAARIVAHRSSVLFRRVRGAGSMILVDMPQHELEAVLRGHPSIWVAVYNSPSCVVVSGTLEALQVLFVELQARQAFVRWVNVDTPGHGPHIDPWMDELRGGFAGVEPAAGELPFYSSVVGGPVSGLDCSAEHWVRNVREPVAFARATRRLLDAGFDTLVEVAPHGVLGPVLEQNVAAAGATAGVSSTGQRDTDETSALQRAIAALYAQGVDIAWSRCPGAGGRVVSLPPYAFARKRHWQDIEPPAVASPEAPSAGLLLGEHRVSSLRAGEHQFQIGLSRRSFPFLDDHRVLGAVIVPATAFLALAADAASAASGSAAVELTEVRLLEALALDADESVQLQTTLRPASDGRTEFCLATPTADGGWTIHVKGFCRPRSELPPPPEAAQRPEAGALAPVADLYERLRARGFEYGPAFQLAASRLQRSDGNWSRVALPADARQVSSCAVHPALLDAAWHVALDAALDRQAGVHVPVSIEQAVLRRTALRSGLAHAALREARRDALTLDGALFGDDGVIAARFRGVKLRALEPQPDRRLVALDWSPAECEIESALPAGATVLLVHAPGFDAAPLARGLEARGVVACSVDADGPFDAERFAAAASVVVLSGLGAREPWQLTDHELLGCGREGWGVALRIVRALLPHREQRLPRLYLVTVAARELEGDDLRLSQAPLWGLAGTIAVEVPELRCTRVDLSQQLELDALAREIAADSREQDVALRAARRYVARLTRSPAAPEPARHEPLGERAVHLVSRAPGTLDALRLEPFEPQEPGAGEVRIAVEASGLNFLDVLKALGTYPDMQPDDAARLGGECAGTVTAVGDGVPASWLGRRVMALVFQRGMRSDVVADVRLVAPVPDRLSWRQAAALPVVYLTAWYALHELARIERGQTLLVHSATGGTGLAALQLAKRAGARVFATAGSVERRAHLVALGASAVFHSRQLDFERGVLEASGGRGVDVVLNSLSGAAIEAGMRCVAPDGHFIELGKRDIYTDRELRLGHFRRGVSFSSVDLEALSVRHPERVGRMLQQVAAAIEAGELEPLPVTGYPIEQASEAFHAMARASHVGKLVLERAQPAARVAVPSGASVERGATYLITGGTGGLGVALARRFAEAGAGHVVLVSRSGSVASEQQGELERVRTLTRVSLPALDVTDGAALRRLVDELVSCGERLRGVVHAAGIIADGMLENQDEATFASVFAAKVAGAWNLHRATEHVPLAFFVLYSSCMALYHLPGQGNYVAANAFLDALAHYRRGRGLPALSVNWGIFSGAGMAADLGNDARMAARGHQLLSAAEGAEALIELLAAGWTQIGVAKLDARQWAAALPVVLSQPSWSRLLADDAGPDRAAAPAAAQQASSAAERLEELEALVSEMLGKVLRLPPDEIEPDLPMQQLGLDSLMNLELRNRLEGALGTKLTAALTWNFPTVKRLARHLHERLAPAPKPEPSSAQPARAPAELERARPGEPAHDQLEARLRRLEERLQ